MQKLTCEFVLPSGVKCKAYQLYGNNYKTLTSGEYEGEEMMLQFILELLLSVGSKQIKHTAENYNSNREFVLSMRAEDKQHILASVRQATMGYEKLFQFLYKWTDENGVAREIEQTFELNDLSKEEGFTQEHIEKLKSIYGDSDEDVEFYKELNKNGTFVATPAMHRASEYDDLPKTYTVILPMSKYEVELSYLNGRGEKFLAAQKKGTLSTNTLIEARFPKYKDGDTWINVRMDYMHMKDIEFLRSAIKKHEGSVSMELTFDNPDKNAKEKTITKNLLSETAFFFPSGALG